VIGPRNDASIASVETFETLKDVDDAAITNILSIVLTYVKYSIFSLTADDKVDVTWWLVLDQFCKLVVRCCP
jgi:hypothetical protein